jgi:hypothetical protein
MPFIEKVFAMLMQVPHASHEAPGFNNASKKGNQK